MCALPNMHACVEWTSCLGWLFSGLEWLTQECPVAMVILIKADGLVPLVHNPLMISLWWALIQFSLMSVHSMWLTAWAYPGTHNGSS